MATTALRFTTPGSAGVPVRLRFGDESDGPPPTGDTTLTLTAAVTQLSGSVPLQIGTRIKLQAAVTALSGSVGLQYVSDTQRPTVGAAHAEWQGAKAVPKAFTARYQRAQALALLQRPNWQVAQPTSAGIAPRWADAGRAARLLVEAGWHAAQPLRAARLSGAWDDAIRLRAGARTGWSAALQMSHAPTRQGYQDADRTCRRWVHEAFANAWHLRRAIRDSGTNGLPVRTARQARYQEAWPPHPGRWVRPVQPPMPDPCYLPGLPVRLVFSEAGLAGVLPPLRFYCERAAPPPEPGATVVVPIRSVYVTINSAILTRLDNGHVIPATDMSMSLDTDSWTWSFSASVPGSALADVLPNVNGDPLIAQAAINGTLFNFALERVNRDRVFNSSQLKVSGRGLGAELDAPYAPQMTFGNTSARTARQLLDDILTFNGVSIGWGVGLWQPTDWLVPAGVFNHSGTYVAALNAVVGAAGAYLQPHDTDRTLDVHLRYPTPAWLWSSVTPDFELPAAVTSQEGFEWVDKPVYNRVFVTGQEHGINGQYTRTGTAGDLVAPSIIDPLITHADAARQRGRAVISDTGRIAMVTLRLPVLDETGIIKPGKFVRYTEGGNTHIGITRGLSVAANLPTIYQTLTVETHVEPI